MATRQIKGKDLWEWLLMVETATSSKVCFPLMYFFFEVMLMSRIDRIGSCLEDYILFLFNVCTIWGRATWHVWQVTHFMEFLIIPTKDMQTINHDTFFIGKNYVLPFASSLRTCIKTLITSLNLSWFNTRSLTFIFFYM